MEQAERVAALQFPGPQAKDPPLAARGAVLGAADPCPPDAQSARLRLTAEGVPAEILLSTHIRVIPAAYGALRRWEFRATGTGRVVVQAHPREVQP